MTGARVRPARPSDAEAIAGIHVATWRTAYAGVLPASYLTALDEGDLAGQWRVLLRDPAAPEEVLVACGQAGTPVGFGSCGPERTSALGYGGEVYTLYIAPDWQGRGLGRRLLAALFRRLTDRGAAGAVIWVLSGNPARFFYERLGGAVVGYRSQPVAGAEIGERAYAWPGLTAWLRDVNA